MSAPPPDRDSPVYAWLRHAEADLEAAEHLSSALRAESNWIIGFHTQQAIEKWIKALLTHAGVHFPKSHDLTELLALVPAPFSSPVHASTLERITDYAVVTRYPHPDEPISAQEVEKAIEAARTFRAAVRAYLPSPGSAAESSDSQSSAADLDQPADLD
jgi:HEPN domain-containing protein